MLNANNKRNARIAIISHLLSQLDYHKKDVKLVSKDYDLVYTATDKTMKEKLF